jgi:hypothetical protein
VRKLVDGRNQAVQYRDCKILISAIFLQQTQDHRIARLRRTNHPSDGLYQESGKRDLKPANEETRILF